MDPFSMIAGISAGSSILGGLLGASSAKKAAAASKKAALEGQRQYNEQSDVATGAVNAGTDAAMGQITPYSEGGTNALQLYLNAVGANGKDAQTGYYNDFQDDPGFAKALETGQNAIEHSRIVKQTSDSGGAMKELYSFGENARLGAYKDRLANLSSLSQIGLQAAGTGANLESNRGLNLANIALKKGDVANQTQTGIGNAQAGSILQQGNAYTGALQGLTSAAMVGAGGQPAFNALYGKAPQFYFGGQPGGTASGVDPASGARLYN